MVKLRDPLSQILEDAEDNDADTFAPLDLDGLHLFVPVKVQAARVRRKVTRRRKK